MKKADLKITPNSPPAGESCQIRFKRFWVADYRLAVRNRICERPKAPIQIDIIDYDSPTGPHGGPSMIQLEAHVAFRMPAVLNEQIDRS